MAMREFYSTMLILTAILLCCSSVGSENTSTRGPTKRDRLSTIDTRPFCPNDSLFNFNFCSINFQILQLSAVITEQEVYRKVFDGYVKDVRPRHDAGDVISISVALHISSIKDFVSNKFFF